MTETMKAIKREMAEQNIKQVDMADRTCISECTISRWLNGKRTPTIDNVEKMAKVLGLRIELMRGVGMTREEREEAIEYIKTYRKLDEDLHNNAPKDSVSYYATDKCLKYWDMSIQALSQEPCTDAVSREAVLKEFEKDTENLYGRIDKLPSVNPQPCDDAISRKTLLTNLYQYKISCAGRIQAAILEVEELVEKMPPVTQKLETVTEFADRCRECGARCGKLLEQKSGKWIEKDGFDGDVYYDCSVCGESWTTIEGTPWDNGMSFCPNCGAKMVEPQESENKESKE